MYHSTAFFNRGKIVTILVCILLLFKTSSPLALDKKIFVVEDTSKIFDTELHPYYSFYIDATGRQTISEVASSPFNISISAIESVSTQFKNKAACCWIRICVKNSVEKSIPMVLFAAGTDRERAYIYQNKKFRLLADNDVLFTKKSKLERGLIPFVIARNEEIVLYISINNQYDRLYNSGYLTGYKGYFLDMRSQVYTHIGKNFFDRKSSYAKELSFLTIILFICLYTLLQYCINNKKEFAWYSLYCFATMCAFVHTFNLGMYMDFPFAYFPPLLAHIDFLLWYFMYFMYLRFARCFVDSQTLGIWYYRAVIYGESFLVSFFAADVILLYLFNDHVMRLQLFILAKFMLIGLSLYGVYLVFKLKINGIKFLAWGLLFLCGFGLLATISDFITAMVSNYKEEWARYVPYSLTFISIGVVLELLCFSMGINYKFYRAEQQKILIQNSLIKQLDENKALQHKLNSELEEMVNVQTRQIIRQREELEKEKERQLQSQFLSKFTVMELQLLKSQLNPHFYFNTLNNLYGLTRIDSNKAAEAILKLGNIMEYVIYDCKYDRVALSKELNFIESYIELEKLRYEDTTNIVLDTQGNSEAKFISPLLLIQFVENAFKHGLEQKRPGGSMIVDITIDNNTLKFNCRNTYWPKPYRKEGLGLNNVMKRLEMLYPKRHSILFHTHEDVYCVELSLDLD